ncbi:hypothetical protein D6825_03310, partial [Candidatus Woesearchaeota archaeon]
MRTRIEKEPLVTMLRSALEDHREVYGLIYGICEEKNYIITSAQPIVSAIRKPSEVNPERLDFDRIEILTSSEEALLGNYHSHIKIRTKEGWAEPSRCFSKADKESLKSEGGLALLLTIEDAKREHPWKLIDDSKRLSGAFRTNKGLHRLVLSAYYLSPQKRIRLSRIDINTKKLT